MIRLSPSTLNLYLECPRCFWLAAVKKIYRPRGPFPSLPSGIDLVLKDYFNQFREKGDIPDILKGKLPGKIVYSLPKSLQYYDDQFDAYLFGQLDECLELDKEIFAPLDHKTRGFPTKEDSHTYYQLQMDAYTLLLEENNYKTKKAAYLAFYFPKRGESIEKGFPFEIEVKEIPTYPEKTREIFKEAVDTLRKSEPPLHSQNCAYCNWVETLKEL